MQSRLASSFTAAALVLLAAAPARADWPRPFVMPPLGAGPELHGEVMFGTVEVGPVDATLLGLELGFRHRLDRLGLSAALPIVHTDTDGWDGTSLGNLTAGVDYLIAGSVRGRRHSATAIGVSLSLPTADDDGDGALAALSHAYFRVPDPGKYFPDTTTIRVFGDWRTGTDQWFFQSHLGMHVLAHDGPDDQVLFRLGLGGGVSLSDTAALIGELTTMADLLDDDGSEDFLHTLDLGVRFLGGSSIFGIRLYLPLRL
jgi:hypothetical protein